MKINLPVTVAVASAVAGVGLAVGGVFVLAGAGWAMLTGALPLIGISMITFRGLMRGANAE